MPSREWRAARHTVLLVGEGKTECAFLCHVKSLYVGRGCGVSAKIRNAHGKGPAHVVDYAIKQCRNAAYNRVIALLDTDLEISAAIQKRAQSKKIRIIGSTPCIEGLLLKILDEPVPSTCAECKSRVNNLLPTTLTTQDNYKTNFPKDVLEIRRHNVLELEALLGCLSFDD